MEEIMDRDEALKTSDEALKELSSALQQGKSEKLLEYLGMMSRFHNYSFGNCILIAMQKPDATLVAGFGKWKEMNRFVKKGEKGIAILAPLVGKKKMDAEPLQPRLRQRKSKRGRSSKIKKGTQLNSRRVSTFIACLRAGQAATEATTVAVACQHPLYCTVRDFC